MWYNPDFYVNQLNLVVEEQQRAMAHMQMVLAQANVEIENLNLLVAYNSSKITSLERYTRRNNIVVFGVPEQVDLWEGIRLVAKILEVPIYPAHVKRAFRIGRSFGTTRPIKIELHSYEKKHEVLTNAYKFKMNGYVQMFITSDLSPADQQINKFLRAQLNRVKAEGNQATIAYDTIKVNGFFYKYAQLIQNPEARFWDYMPLL